MFNAIVIGWFISFGFVPLQSESVGNHWFKIDPSMTATMAEIGIDCTIDDKLKIFTEMDNYQYKDPNDLYFFPYRIDYHFGLEYDINKYISITAEHKCIHEVVFNNRTGYGFAENETKIYATLHGETKLR